MIMPYASRLVEAFSLWMWRSTLDDHNSLFCAVYACDNTFLVSSVEHPRRKPCSKEASETPLATLPQFPQSQTTRQSVASPKVPNVDRRPLGVQWFFDIFWLVWDTLTKLSGTLEKQGNISKYEITQAQKGCRCVLMIMACDGMWAMFETILRFHYAGWFIGWLKSPYLAIIISYIN